MATLNGVAISPGLMHIILTSFMALLEERRVGPDLQLAGPLTVCNAFDVPGDKEMLALVAHLRISALNAATTPTDSWRMKVNMPGLSIAGTQPSTLSARPPK